ncbi:MAG: hypothetical protein DLM58_17365 [Pseudonocardiales bacterium]|nr:MAG: hypothetical protein DLM58_17365 [Pseudonocardiales bacterium]
MFGFFSRLLAGPSPVIVACIVLVGLVAAATVCWMLVRLAVDPRARIGDDPEIDCQPDQHVPRETAHESGLTLLWEDAAG